MCGYVCDVLCCCGSQRFDLESVGCAVLWCVAVFSIMCVACWWFLHERCGCADVVYELSVASWYDMLCMRIVTAVCMRCVFAMIWWFVVLLCVALSCNVLLCVVCLFGMCLLSDGCVLFGCCWLYDTGRPALICSVLCCCWLSIRYVIAGACWLVLWCVVCLYCWCVTVFRISHSCLCCCSWLRSCCFCFEMPCLIARCWCDAYCIDVVCDGVRLRLLCSCL